MKHLIKSLLFLVTVTSLRVQAGLDSDVAHLQQRWAEVNYQLEGKTQLSEFERLVEEADKVTAA